MAAQTPSQNRPVHRTQQDIHDDPAEYTLYPVTRPNAKAWQTSILAEDHNLLMKVDKGAAVMVVSEIVGMVQVLAPVNSLPW